MENWSVVRLSLFRLRPVAGLGASPAAAGEARTRRRDVVASVGSLHASAIGQASNLPDRSVMTCKLSIPKGTIQKAKNRI